jgi:hypothetical protein
MTRRKPTPTLEQSHEETVFLSFRDAAGRTWVIPTITYTLVQGVQQRMGANLWDLSGDVWGKLADTPELLVRVLWCLCEAQADRLGVEPEDFGRSLGGDVISHAVEALTAAVAASLRRPQRLLLTAAFQAAGVAGGR